MKKILSLLVLISICLPGCGDIAKRTVYQSFQSASCRDRVKNLPNNSREQLECMSGNQPGTMSYDDYQKTRKKVGQAKGQANSRDESANPDEEFNLPDEI